MVRGPSNSLLLDLEGEAALIRRIWQAAPRLSLVHDVGRGGVGAAVAEMAEWSGVAARVDALDGDDVRFVLACAPDAVPDFAEQVGTV